MSTNLLGGLSPRQFLAEYWQKKPLLVRQAVPGFTGLATREEIFDLACDPDVESRYVRYRPEAPGASSVEHGPQRRGRLRGKREPWTVLVQGLNLWVAEADALMRRFDFIPQARLDDLMVSYAVDGGGVGPHFDNYDVFLLQGIGKRRWQIADQDDHTLVEGAPLRLLRDFRPVHDWVLEPGDMLYLPPHWAHNGIAIGECTTYSIGFKSPTAQELAHGFLDWLGEHLCLEGMYADPDPALQDNSAEIPPAMIDQAARMLEGIRWSRADIAAFLGGYLTEPKPNVFFTPPAAPLGRDAFARALAAHGGALDARTLLLWSEQAGFHINGEALACDPADRGALAALAHRRALDAGQPLSPRLLDLFHTWYEDGFFHLTDEPSPCFNPRP
ncbi:MAG: cupin domain-containing protein [Azoarcus sp.]|jgi:50S ribosomal protein L16 3-hydroxylase|nr:cupin domain-containing protein [Azoarcus sp.]